MNKNLIPTPITDKNGKQTTVHKKPSSTRKASSVPPPSLPTVEDTSKLRATVTDRIKALYDAHHAAGFDYMSYLVKDIEGYSERTLHNLSIALQNDDELGQGVAEHIVHGAGQSTLNETIHYYRITGSTNYAQTAAGLQALGEYPDVNMHDDLSLVDEHTQKQCLALMKFTLLIDTLPEAPSPFLDYVDSDTADMRIIRNSGLVTLIANRPDDVERIAEIVLEYRTSNAAAINGIMEGSLPTMAEGYL